MTKRWFFFVLMCLLLVGLGCNLPAGILATLTPTATLPPPTAERVQVPTVTKEVEPVIPPTITSEPPQPPVVEMPSTFPVGFLTTSGDGAVVTFYDLSGQPLGIIQTPGLSSGPGNYLHIAGAFAGNPQDLPVVFHTYENMGDLKQTLNGQVNTIVPGPDVANVLGAPGQNAYVYSTVTWTGETLSSYFFVRSPSSSGTSWIWERADPESWAMVPLSLDAENNEPRSIFYTLEPWGIGGDIVFPPRKGLFQLNLENMDNIQHLTEDFNPIGLAPDNSLVAYTEVNNNIGAGTRARITLYNLDSSMIVPIELAPESDRGGGYAVFSPDDQYAAWMEGAGWLMAETPSFHSRVRIADIGGVVLVDIPDTTFAGVAADPTAHWAIPVGWLDGEHLLVEVRGDDWNQPTLVMVRYDGTNMSTLATGNFSGFLYP
jgi:hypothetical protein